MQRRGSRWRTVAIGAFILMMVGSAPWCRWFWKPQAPQVVDAAHTQGPLRAGWFRAPFEVSWPLPLAGYGLSRPMASKPVQPLGAQAIVLEANGLKVALVSLDLLLVTESLSQAIRDRASSLGLRAVFVSATHTHSSVGGYEPDPVFQIAGTGRYRPAVRQAIVDAGFRALEAATRTLEPVGLSRMHATAENLVGGRDGFESNGEIWGIEFRNHSDAAEIVFVAAHPTLAGHAPMADADYPGAWGSAAQPERSLTLVFQNQAGNAAALIPANEAAGPNAYARLLANRLHSGVAMRPISSVGEHGYSLAFSRVHVSLPCPDASRLVPFLVAPLASSLMCLWSPEQAEVGVLDIGGVSFATIPGEPTFDAKGRLAGAALTGGYVGYIEHPERVRERTGESKRQYFGPELWEVFALGVDSAREAASVPRSRF